MPWKPDARDVGDRASYLTEAPHNPKYHKKTLFFLRVLYNLFQARLASHVCMPGQGV